MSKYTCGDCVATDYSFCEACAIAELQRGFMVAHYLWEMNWLWGLMDNMATDSDRLQAELSRAKDQALRISQVYNAWATGDEPEGAPSGSRTLNAIGEILEGR